MVYFFLPFWSCRKAPQSSFRDFSHTVRKGTKEEEKRNNEEVDNSESSPRVVNHGSRFMNNRKPRGYFVIIHNLAGKGAKGKERKREREDYDIPPQLYFRRYSRIRLKPKNAYYK